MLAARRAARALNPDLSLCGTLSCKEEGNLNPQNSDLLGIYSLKRHICLAFAKLRIDYEQSFPHVRYVSVIGATASDLDSMYSPLFSSEDFPANGQVETKTVYGSADKPDGSLMGAAASLTLNLMSKRRPFLSGDLALK